MSLVVNEMSDSNLLGKTAMVSVKAVHYNFQLLVHHLYLCTRRGT